MNLERVEEICLQILAESSIPVVSVGVLLGRLRRDPALARLGGPELLSFLREHEEIEVLEGGENAGESMELLSAAGIDPGPRAVLKRRIPSPREMQAHLAVQLETMRQVLMDARKSAAASPEAESRLKSIDEALARTEELREQLGKMV